jgi:hypothetical protein
MAALLFASALVFEYTYWRDLTGQASMLWTVFVVVLVLWLLGIVSAHTFGGFIHVLLALAVAVALMRAIHGRKSAD